MKSLPVNKYGGGRHIPPPVEFMCRPSSSLNKHDSTNHQPSPPALAIHYPRVLRYTALHCAKNSGHLEFSCEASPHKRRLKCDTNISPRRLMTHLLHQMVHHRTTLRGNGQRSATIARITTHTHTTILIIKRGHQSLASCGITCG